IEELKEDHNEGLEVEGIVVNHAIRKPGNRWKPCSHSCCTTRAWNPSATRTIGIEDVLIGDLKYSYAISRKDNLYQKDYATRHDFNVAGFKTNPGGELELGLSYIEKAGGRDTNSGWAITAQHVQKPFLGGKNKFALQYGEGPGTGLGYTGNTFLDKS
ncbi:carbohydrate porin, partial [Klebsiella pneumoniae]|uniref:carbohydrate porin n=1 Tax=Klebsiella pneumoniae TaxID=573 RepID=UPI0027312446